MNSAKVALVLFLLATFLFACRAESGMSASDAGIKMTLEMESDPAVVGDTVRGRRFPSCAVQQVACPK